MKRAVVLLLALAVSLPVFALDAGKKAIFFKAPTLQGKGVVDLKAYRGKVVYLDFWASWCKPCRMENPNVVRNYKKYKDQGFEVFSVSLDNPNGKEKWKAAVAKDSLIWPSHVSDLKGWKSVVTQTYNVNSIPFTVLIDQEGKIIGTNFRGAKLEEQLKVIFGS